MPVYGTHDEVKVVYSHKKNIAKICQVFMVRMSS